MPAPHAPLRRRRAVLVLALRFVRPRLTRRRSLVGNPALPGRAALARHAALARRLPLLAWRVGLLTGFPGLA